MTGRRVALFAALLAALCSPAWTQGVITTFAGTDWVFPGDGKPAINAPLGGVWGTTIDPAGNPVLVDVDNCIVARVELSGKLTIIAGNGICTYSGDGGAATSAGLTRPYSATYDKAGNLYILSASSIRKVTTAGIITAIAGKTGMSFGGDTGPAVNASLNSLGGIAVDNAGVIYFADGNNNRVRKIDANGIINTIAGNGQQGGTGDGGPAINASLFSPRGLALDTAGNIYIADTDTGRIRKIVPGGTISSVATAAFPDSVAVAQDGTLYIGEGPAVKKLAPGSTAPETIAGSKFGSPGFAGDGGPAANALLNSVFGLALDTAGNLFVADYSNSRLRKIDTGGKINTIAGNGNFRYGGENVAAVGASLRSTFFGLAIDRAGNVYVAENGGHRIRKIAQGVLTTIAGTGVPGPGTESVPATQSPLDFPRGLVFDDTGNLYFTDGVGQLRKITPSGIISTFALVPNCTGITRDVAGNLFVACEDSTVRKVDSKGNVTLVAGAGGFGNSGDNGPATKALLGYPRSLVFDSSGNLFVADFFNHVIRKITPDGTITTVVGNGTFGSGGDGGPALQAQLFNPTALAFDKNGNLYIADAPLGVVRKVTPQGTISAFAGGGTAFTVGDGKVATSATLMSPDSLLFDPAGNLYIGDSNSGRIRVVLVNPPSMQVSPASLIFSAPSGGAATSQALTVQGALAGLDFAVAVDTGNSGKWLTAEVTSGSTPRVLNIFADPSSLAPGSYTGTVTITPSAAMPGKLTVTVSFTVTTAQAPKLAVDKSNFSFTFPQGAAARSSALMVSNAGGGTINFTASATSRGWLSVAPVAGTARPGKPVSLSITADPSGLAAGTYTGTVRVLGDAGESISVPVTITVSSLSQALILTQTGLSFTAVLGGGVVPPQSFGVVNAGTGVLAWKASTSTLGGGPGWLNVSPATGSSDASAQAPQVTVSVNPFGIAPGDYYGQVRIDAPGAANTPQVVTVFLEVLPAGSDPGAVVQPAELVFNTTFQTVPGSQALTLYNVGAQPKTVRTDHSFGLQFIGAPGELTLDPNQPARVLVQPTSQFSTGTYTSLLTFQFSDGRVQTVKITMIVGPRPAQSAGPGSAASPAATCSPTSLFPALTSLGDSFAVSAGWPVALGVIVRDDCGNPHTSGSVVVSFSNGDPPLTLTSLRDGTWQGTWQTKSTALAGVKLKVDAVNPQLSISGSRQIDGSFRPAKDPPAFTQSAIGNAGIPVSFAALAPGEIVSIFGDRLADNTDSGSTLPLPTQLGNTQVIIGGQIAPLFFVSQFQVNALVPFELNPNTTHQVLIQRGQTYSQPVSVDVGPAQPVPFIAFGFAIAVAYRANTDPFLVGLNERATAGDVLVFYCAGLGATDPPVASGVSSPSGPLAQTKSPVTVSIGGQNAPVSFAGLSPGFVGLYQVNVTVPGGITPSQSAPVIISVAGQTGATSSLPIK